MTSQQSPRAERLQLAGPSGAIEALIETPAVVDAAAFGVVLHPHPLFGGTLENKVVYTLARAFQEFGVPTIRFNFRGVGASAGEFGEGVGETEDALATIALGRKRWPGAELWLGGFSFGAVVAIRAAAAGHAARLVTVAPAISRLDVSAAAVPSCPWLIVQGDADELVNPREVIDWAGRLTPSPEVAVMPGVGHYFHGKLHELRAVVTAFLAKQKPG